MGNLKEGDRREEFGGVHFWITLKWVLKKKERDGVVWIYLAETGTGGGLV
jgi:hypothetical protein